MSKKIVLGLVGEKGAGKGTVSDLLIEKYGAVHFGTSNILKRTVSDLHLELSRDNFAKLALVLKEGFGATVVVDSLIQDIENKAGDAQIVIADGIRMHDDIRPFKEKYGLDFYLLYVTADVRLRHERTKQRKEKAGEDKMSFQEFLAEESRLTELSISEVGKQADFILNNDKTAEDLKEQVNEVMEKILKIANGEYKK